MVGRYLPDPGRNGADPPADGNYRVPTSRHRAENTDERHLSWRDSVSHRRLHRADHSYFATGHRSLVTAHFRALAFRLQRGSVQPAHARAPRLRCRLRSRSVAAKTRFPPVRSSMQTKSRSVTSFRECGFRSEWAPRYPLFSGLSRDLGSHGP